MEAATAMMAFFAAPGLDPQELGAQVRVLRAHGGPGAGDECLQPGPALADARGAALAGALVVPRAQAGPGNEVAGAREARHVDADLRHDDLGGDVTDSRHRRQELAARE
jgi:hypothetical protein